MDNKWYGAFPFERVEQFREAAKKDPSVAADIQMATGNNMELTQKILNGPDEDTIRALQSGEDPRIPKAFDDIWGVGASEHYMEYDTNSIWDNLGEIPRGIATGVAGAVAETGETFFNTTGEADAEAREAKNAYDAYLAEKRGTVAPEATPVEPYDRKEWDAQDVLPVNAPETGTGKAVEGITQFLAPFLVLQGSGATLKFEALLKAPKVAAVLTTMFNGAAVDYTAFDEDVPTVTASLADYFGVESEFIDSYLRSEIDDSDFSKRIKRTAEGAVIGLAADGLMMGAAAVIRKYRAGGATKQEAVEEVSKLIAEADEARVLSESNGTASTPITGEPVDLWHFREDAAGAIAEAEAKAVASVADEATEGASAVSATKVEEEGVEAATEAPTATDSEPKVEPLPLKFSEYVESVEGVKTKPTVSKADRAKAIARAQRIYQAARENDASQAWGSVTEFLRTAVDDLGEQAGRTRAQLADAVAPIYNRVAGMVENGNIKGIQDYVMGASNPNEFKIKALAVQLAAKASRAELDKMALMVEAAEAGGKLSVHDKVALRQMFHAQAQFAMELQALDTNIGSLHGAALGQRAAHMDVTELLNKRIREIAKEAKEQGKTTAQQIKSQKQILKEYRDQIARQIREERKGSDADWMVRKYRDMVKAGVEPVDAFKHVSNMKQAADRAGIKLSPGKTKTEKAVDKATGEVKDGLKEAPKESTGDKILRGLEQWRYNAMLSGLKTHETNFLSTSIHALSSIAYEGIWGVISRNPVLRRAAIRKASGMVNGLRDSGRYAIEAYKEMKPILDGTSAFERLDPVYRNHILTYPTRVMLATDQFVKQMVYRGEVTARAHYEADLAKMNPADRVAYVTQKVKAAFEPGTGAGNDALAMERANEMAFQNHFRKDSKYGTDRAMAWANDVLVDTYVGRLMFPFMRIFFRLTDTGIRMTPVVRETLGILSAIQNAAHGKIGSTRYIEDLMGKNGMEAQAKAAVEYGVGLGLTGWTLSMVADGRITGGEEVSYVDAMMRKKVVPPYSIRIGDTWYDYSRYEPFAFPMKVMANWAIKKKRVEAADKRGEYEREGEKDQAMLGAFAFTLAQVVSNNSFMEGMESLIKMTSGSYEGTDRWKQPVYTMADSYVPNILRKINDSFDDSGNKYSTRNYMDRFKRHFSSLTDMSEVDLDRNQYTGEPYVYTDDDDGAGWTNFEGRPVVQDKAMELLIQANENTGVAPMVKRPTEFFSNTDLRTIPQDGGGRSLYDQYLDTFSTIKSPTGLTYREALEQLADNPRFAALPWGNSTRVKGTKVEAISEIKNAYQKLAETWMENNSKSYRYQAGLQGMYEQRQQRKEAAALLGISP